jgi:hypothetical protein
MGKSMTAKQEIEFGMHQHKMAKAHLDLSYKVEEVYKAHKLTPSDMLTLLQKEFNVYLSVLTKRK